MHSTYKQQTDNTTLHQFVTTCGAMMVSSFGITLLLVCVAVSAVVAENPTPCCPPKQFVITIYELTTNVVNGTVITDEVKVVKAYDATNKLMTDILSQYDSNTGTTEHSKTIYLFPQGAKYVIKDGKCTKEALSYQFLELCVPSIAEFSATYTIGLGQYSFNSFKLSSPEQGYDLEYQFAYGQEKCIPYQFSVEKVASGMGGRASSSGGPLPLTPPLGEPGFTAGADGPLSSYAQYSDYIEGIADPAYWFKPPPECDKPANQQEAAAKKMSDKIKELFRNGKELVVY